MDRNDGVEAALVLVAVGAGALIGLLFDNLGLGIVIGGGAGAAAVGIIEWQRCKRRTPGSS